MMTKKHYKKGIITMKITNFTISYIDNRLFLISLFLLFSMFMLLIAYERLNKLIFLFYLD